MLLASPSRARAGSPERSADYRHVPPVPTERIACRTCRRTTRHTVAGKPPRHTWRCIICNTIEHRNPHTRQDEHDAMHDLGLESNRRRSDRHQAA
jgi:hypothetical protein